jgi:catechol 2,3-dioxygenase-like lactoylglutathione lyase family enzyme/uncharacterized protein YndB with AHSA1/START domain
MSELPINQIAISVKSVQHTQRWYRDIFGFVEAGGTPAFIPSLGSADVQGVPGATSECWWLNDSQDFFQIELFEFRKPEPKPLPADWRPCDIGYTMMGLHVVDFDATLARLAHRQVALLTEPMGEPGARRVCVKDPNGVLLEVMEDDPRAAEQRDRVRDLPVATRFLTLSVPDLAQARNTWLHVLGLLEETDIVLHTPEHEALWGLAGATRESFVASAGDIFLEVVQYADPVGAPWPEGYVISDHGLLNVSLGIRDEQDHDALIAHCIDHGLLPNSTKPTLLKKLWYAVYVNDPMGFSIELLYHKRAGTKEKINPLHLLELGFAPAHAPVTRSSATAISAAPPERVWQVLTDHEHMSQWSPFGSSQVVSPGVGGGQVGLVRRLSNGPAKLAVTETMVVAEAPNRLEYTAKGAPMHWMYHGFVSLEPTPGGGTTITWEAQFRTPVRGPGIVTTQMLKRLTNGLARASEVPVPVA